MSRTKLADRSLPDYTVGEEVFNMASHAVGGAFGIFALVLCVVWSALTSDAWAIVSSAIYGTSLVMLYTMSSVYHGVRPPMAKKVLQVIDHCTIYFLIAGSYTPVVLCAVRRVSPGWGWTLFGIVWGCAIMATVFTAIDLRKYRVLSMSCYLGMGWSVIIAIKPVMQAIETGGLWLLFSGGIAYTVGSILYGLGKNHRYMHSVFHVFVVAGSVMQFLCILLYVL